MAPWRPVGLPLLLSHIAACIWLRSSAFRHLVWAPLHGVFLLTFLYLAGVFLKGSIWAIAYKVQNTASKAGCIGR